jgi:hypothetical protein
MMDSKSTSKAFPGFDKIYSLEETGLVSAFRGDLGVKTTSEAFALTRAELHPASPITVTWAMGHTQPVDVIWTTYAGPIIVADSVVQLLRSYGFTGWSLYEVSVRGKQSEPIPSYSGLAVTGRCGSLEHSMSAQVPRIYPGGVFPVWKGLLFDPTTWDGSDFFMPSQKVAHLFVVEEVKKAFEQAKIRNVEFTPLNQFERSWKV